MQIPPVALKRKQHRLLLCETARKNTLLAQLIETHRDKRIAVVLSGGTVDTVLSGDVVVLTDDALPVVDEASFDLVISYDLPSEPQRYLERLALCEELALTLLGETDRAHLLAIETLLGRAISQESPEGFAPALPAQPKHLPKRHQKSNAPQRGEAAPKKPPFKNEGKPAQKRKPKESGVSRYIGTDENGKPMFSGKTGERNHRKDGKPHTEESFAAKQEWEEKRKKEGGQKKAFDKKKPPFKGEKKPFGAKGPAKGPKAQSSEAAKPKRPPRRIKADAFKPTEPKK